MTGANALPYNPKPPVFYFTLL
eukprot:IDg6771t1